LSFTVTCHRHEPDMRQECSRGSTASAYEIPRDEFNVFPKLHTRIIIASGRRFDQCSCEAICVLNIYNSGRLDTGARMR
jgi:hypothetical protein